MHNDLAPFFPTKPVKVVEPAAKVQFPASLTAYMTLYYGGGIGSPNNSIASTNAFTDSVADAK